MKKLLWLLTVVGCATTSNSAPQGAQTTPARCAELPAPPPSAAEAAAPSPSPSPGPSPSPQPAAAVDNGLDDLAKITFDCPKAALNAAAREAAKAPTEGSYQFSHFDVVSDSHQAVYEVAFKSNYPGEPLLRYCVAIYCQQGWDPKNTQASVTLLNEPAPTGHSARAAADAACGGKHTHAAARKIE